MIRRRSVLSLAATATLARPALSQAAQLTMCVWGGGGALVWRESFVAQFSHAPVRVVEVPIPAGALRSPAAASQYNLGLVTYFEAIALAQAGLIETFTPAEIPNLAQMRPEYLPRNAQDRALGVPVYYTFYGIAYNRELARAEDFSSWRNLSDAKWRGKLSVTRPVYAAPYDLVIMSKAMGGDERNIQPGIPLLRSVVENSLTTYSSLAHMNTLLTRNEVAAVPYYASRVWSLQRQGVNQVDIVMPREGILAQPYVLVAPKNLRNRDATLRFLDYVAGAEPQGRAAAMDGWLPTNARAPSSPEFERIIRIPYAELTSKLYMPDWRVIVETNEERVNMVEQLMAAVRR